MTQERITVTAGEAVRIVAPGAQAKTILDAVVEAGDLTTPGLGIAFVSSIEYAVGLIPVSGNHPQNETASAASRIGGVKPA